MSSQISRVKSDYPSLVEGESHFILLLLLDQVFVVRHVCEKYLANGKDVF